MKRCTSCLIEKPISQYYLCSANKDGRETQCKHCRYIKRKEQKLIYSKTHREQQQKYRNKNRLKINKKIKDYRIKNSEHCKKVKKAWDIKNPNYSKNYHLKNKDIISQKSRKRYLKNKDKIFKKVKLRLKTDIQFKLRNYLRARIWSALKRHGKSNKKSARTRELIGCDFDFLKKYLESKFKIGMSWNNYGKWHVDHIKPCCSFDLTIPEEQQKCFHYTNLQPLWETENFSKNRFF